MKLSGRVGEVRIEVKAIYYEIITDLNRLQPLVQDVGLHLESPSACQVCSSLQCSARSTFADDQPQELESK